MAEETKISVLRVATALTACGIETKVCKCSLVPNAMLQRRLPLAVLKHTGPHRPLESQVVATALTACGIETLAHPSKLLITNISVATALTACGIETFNFYA